MRSRTSGCLERIGEFARSHQRFGDRLRFVTQQEAGALGRQDGIGAEGKGEGEYQRDRDAALQANTPFNPRSDTDIRRFHQELLLSITPPLHPLSSRSPTTG